MKLLHYTRTPDDTNGPFEYVVICDDCDDIHLTDGFELAGEYELAGDCTLPTETELGRMLIDCRAKSVRNQEIAAEIAAEDAGQVYRDPT